MCDWVTYFWLWGWLLLAEVMVGMITGLYKESSFSFQVSRCLSCQKTLSLQRYQRHMSLFKKNKNKFMFI